MGQAALGLAALAALALAAAVGLLLARAALASRAARRGLLALLALAYATNLVLQRAGCGPGGEGPPLAGASALLAFAREEMARAATPRWPEAPALLAALPDEGPGWFLFSSVSPWTWRRVWRAEADLGDRLGPFGLWFTDRRCLLAFDDRR